MPAFWVSSIAGERTCGISASVYVGQRSGVNDGHESIEYASCNSNHSFPHSSLVGWIWCVEWPPASSDRVPAFIRLQMLNCPSDGQKASLGIGKAWRWHWLSSPPGDQLWNLSSKINGHCLFSTLFSYLFIQCVTTLHWPKVSRLVCVNWGTTDRLWGGSQTFSDLSGILSISYTLCIYGRL